MASFTAAIVASAALFQSVQATTYAPVLLPYVDGQCKNLVNGSTGTNTIEADGTPGYALYTTATSNVAMGLPAEDGYQTFTDLTFPGAESDGSGYDVYWQLPDMDGCRIVMMTDYTEGEYGSMGSNVAPGNVIVNSRSSGCFYTNLAVDKDLMVTSCCGENECKAFAIGDTNLLSKRKEKRDEFSVAEEVAKIGSVVTINNNDTEMISSRSESSVTARAAKAVADKSKRDSSTPVLAARDSSCTPVSLSDEFPQAGNQVIATQSQTCTQSGCSFAVSFQYSASTTLTTDTTTDITNTVGASVSVEAGENLLIESASVTAEASWDIAVGTSTSTGTQITNGTSITITNTIIQPQGSTGFVSFTPSYSCRTFYSDCGHGVSDNLFTQCEPSMVGNLEINGELLYVATD